MMFKQTKLTLAIDCGHIPSPENGKVVFNPNTLFGSTAEFSCKRGFRLMGTSERECEATGWSLEQPTCESMLHL